MDECLVVNISFSTMKSLWIYAQTTNIDKKIQEAPDKWYEIGVVIGTYLPFIVLVIIAYLLYYYRKRKRQD